MLRSNRRLKMTDSELEVYLSENNDERVESAKEE